MTQIIMPYVYDNVHLLIMPILSYRPSIRIQGRFKSYLI